MYSVLRTMRISAPSPRWADAQLPKQTMSRLCAEYPLVDGRSKIALPGESGHDALVQACFMNRDQAR